MNIKISNHSNYLAKIVKLNDPIPHPNADKLEGFVIDGNTVWYSKGLLTKDDIVVYFPIECQINKNILRVLNLYNDKTLNEDPTANGYFNHQARVKAVKLRREPSEGFIMQFGELLSALDKLGVSTDFEYTTRFSNELIDAEFDTINDCIICQKYVPVVRNSGANPERARNQQRLDHIIVPGQFRFHRDTPKLLPKTLESINPNHLVNISLKLHGTSAVFANLLVNKKLSFFEKIKKFFGFRVNTTEYKRMYSSRSVVKFIEDYYRTPTQGYYDSDVWRVTYEKLKDYLTPAMTIYGEIVGYTPTGSYIQKGYDYGCEHGKSAFYIYRITTTSDGGVPIEWSSQEIDEFVWRVSSHENVNNLMKGLNSDIIDIARVPILNENCTLLELYQNKLNNKRAKKIKADELFMALKKEYLEGDSVMCKNKLPEEGIVLTVDRGQSFKLKSFRFLEGESKALDSDDQSENLEIDG